MQYGFEELMAGKSNEDLRVYITDCARYQPAAIEAAIDEFKKRGIIIEGPELEKVNATITQKKADEKAEEYALVFPKQRSDNVVAYMEAPEFYSKRVIYVFSILFGEITGAILLAININKGGDKKGVIPVLFFGIFYFVATCLLIGYVPDNGRSLGTALGFLLNAIGASVLNNFFWNKYIGKETKHKPRPFWTPLFICIAVLVVFFALAFHAAKFK
jgi:hypothetical protein